MQGKLIWPIFWALIAAFVVLVSARAIPAARELVRGFPFIAISGAVLLLLGVVLIVLTVKGKVGGRLKKFLILTGASAAGIPVSIFLHNAIYALFIYLFGAGFWNGGDEPFFFIIAVFVCPIGFLVGAVGSIVLAKRRYRQLGVT